MISGLRSHPLWSLSREPKPSPVEVDRHNAAFEDDENSSLFLFRFDRNDGSMSPLLTESGRNLSTAAYPLVLSCH